jgi:hypothetical protein
VLKRGQKINDHGTDGELATNRSRRRMIADGAGAGHVERVVGVEEFARRDGGGGEGGEAA